MSMCILPSTHATFLIQQVEEVVTRQAKRSDLGYTSVGNPG